MFCDTSIEPVAQPVTFVRPVVALRKKRRRVIFEAKPVYKQGRFAVVSQEVYGVECYYVVEDLPDALFQVLKENGSFTECREMVDKLYKASVGKQ